MGLLDRLLGKKVNGAPVTPVVSPSPEENRTEPVGQNEVPAEPKSVTGPTLPRLAEAREKLAAKDLAGALAIYEALLAEAGDRADVLVRISGDLGAHGHVKEIVELVAPRYDAERHGPATGLNVLQAYLLLHNPDAAQHVLDILFALKRPELEERLFGFANAIAEQVEARNRGQLAPSELEGGAPKAAKVNLISISKPIWFYGLESLAEEILPPKNGRLRRVAFAPIGVAGVGREPAEANSALARLARGLTLWLTEVIYFSPAYAPIAVVGIQERPDAANHFAVFPFEWGTEHIRQLVEGPNGEGLDYVFTGLIREQDGKFELGLRLWEVRKMKDRKQFSVQWTDENASEVLGQLAMTLRQFMEAALYPAGQGLAYVQPGAVRVWLDVLEAEESLFLVEKKLLPSEQMAPAGEVLRALAAINEPSAISSLAGLTLHARARSLGGTDLPAPMVLATDPLVQRAHALLG